MALTSFAPKPDSWIDPAAYQLEQAVLTHVDAAHTVAIEDQRTTRSFGLPGLKLDVDILGIDLGEALTLAFAHRAGIAAKEAQTAGSPAVRRLHWSIVDTTLLAAASRSALPALADPPLPIQKLGAMYCSADNALLIERRRGFVTLFRPAENHLITLAQGLDAIDTDLAAKPLLRFLIPLLLPQGFVLCHAALVGGTATGTLVPGRAGIGKSTISAASVLAGAGFCSDDFVALEQRADGLWGHCLFATLMLGAGHMDNFPELAEHAVRYRHDVFVKRMVPIGRAFPDRVRQSLRVTGAAVPHVVPDKASALVPASRAAVLRALTPSSVFFSPWREAERARFLFDAASALPAFTWQSGSDFSRIATPLLAAHAH